jgi:hypothetical protein
MDIKDIEKYITTKALQYKHLLKYKREDLIKLARIRYNKLNDLKILKNDFLRIALGGKI